jgi:peptidoglycan/LPS O-acetylase OafA/YrhL
MHGAPILLRASGRSRRGAAAAVLGLGLLCLGTPAWAATSAAGPMASSPTRSDEARAWVGRYCPPQGCTGQSSAPMASALGFALAVSVGGLLSRGRGDRSA